nr:LOW QUALITY PROTEIN: lysosomal alpha-glucosidase-like [Ciona intestinalis]|eukprot:XP_026694311.1 LOW QUALITY PROTEIN: lysosomal alpha-glucosidase-like [Ciona intestinalis]
MHFLWWLVLAISCEAALGYTAATCPSTVPEWSRVDCYPESGSNEASCNSRGCMWCEASVQGPPWCFYDDATTAAPPGEGCSSCSSCSNKVDCYPEAGSSEGGCYDRGCLWCPSNVPNEPWCLVPDGGAIVNPPIQTLDVLLTSQKPRESIVILVEELLNLDVRVLAAFGARAILMAYHGVFSTQPIFQKVLTMMKESIAFLKGFSPSLCTERSCAFANTNSPNAPMCYFQNDQYGYSMQGTPVATYNGYRVTLNRIHTSTLFGDDVDTVTLDVTFDTQSRIHIKFYDSSEDRFEVPLTINGADPSPPSNPLYDIQFFNDPSFYFKVIRQSTGAVLLDTSLGGLTFSNQFLQIATRVPTKTMYGFGEQEHQTLAHTFEWESFGMYARDQPPDPGANLYGTHPFYVSVEDDGKSHGVLFLNSNAQDVTLTPAPGVVYRTIGGVLDMYVFLGPEPNSVIEQYNTAIGTPFMPPYWSLGFQLCRYGYGSLDVVKATVARMDAYDIPMDVQYGDIDYMDERRDFTYDHTNYAGLPDYVKQLQSGGKHYIIILDPCITEDDPAGTYPPYDIGASMNVFVTESDGVTPASGRVWPPGQCAFPDYTNPDTETWWTDQCVDFHKTINFDGLWIDMNEPANFVAGSTSGCATNALNNPPYKPKIWGDILADKTMCPDHLHKLGNHYDVHNLYGWSQSNVTILSATAATGKRPFVVSRSTYVGSGQWAAHWLGDNNSDWHDLKMSVIGMLEFNMFGIPYVGADICGFNGDAQEELCDRWMELGAFYPFSRNHNGLGYKEQDPAAWGDAFAARSRAVLRTRYTLLPYLYELFYTAHTAGTGIVRPLSFEFINDVNTITIDEQFMWGPALLFSPVLYQGETSVSAYFPDARWYDYANGVELGTRGNVASISAPIGTIPIHVRGGYVIPTQEPASNTELSRKNPFGLIIALDDSGSAVGQMYWDQGDTLNPILSGQHALFTFSAQNNKLTTSASGSSSIMSSMTMGSLRIMGVSSSPQSVTVNGVSKSFTVSNSQVTVSNINVVMSGSFEVQW